MLWKHGWSKLKSITKKIAFLLFLLVRADFGIRTHSVFLLFSHSASGNFSVKQVNGQEGEAGVSIREVVTTVMPEATNGKIT